MRFGARRPATAEPGWVTVREAAIGLARDSALPPQRRAKDDRGQGLHDQSRFHPLEPPVAQEAERPVPPDDPVAEKSGQPQNSA